LINKTLTKLGPIVLVVILRTNGEMEEKSIDMTPKKDLVKQEIGGHPITFLGQSCHIQIRVDCLMLAGFVCFYVER
jgi:hypothetical protein